MNKPQKPLTLLNRSLIPTFTKVQGQEILTVTESRTYWINDKELTRDLHRSPNGSPFRQGVIRNLRSLAEVDSADESWKVSGSDTAPVVTMAKTRRIKPEDITHVAYDKPTSVLDVFVNTDMRTIVVSYDTGELYTADFGNLPAVDELDVRMGIEAYKVRNKLLILRV